MKIMNRFSAVAAGVLFLGVSSQASNLISNGSFEAGHFVGNADGTMSLAPGATDIDGWIVTQGALAWIGPNNPFGLTASDGGYFLDLSGYHDNSPYSGVTASQRLATQIGRTYRFSLDLGSSIFYDDSPPMVEMNLGDKSILFGFSPSRLNQWQTFAFNFTATSENTSFSIAGTGLDNLAYIGVDNISVVALPASVPEPSVFGLVGMAATAMVLFRRRK